jgi:hypothetical protein
VRVQCHDGGLFVYLVPVSGSSLELVGGACTVLSDGLTPSDAVAPGSVVDIPPTAVVCVEAMFSDPAAKQCKQMPLTSNQDA